MMDPLAQQILGFIERGEIDDRRRLREIVAPENVWIELIAARPDLLRAVTLNKHLPREILARLADDADPDVRFDVAMKRKLPTEIFFLLAADRDESVRHRVALNPKLPREVLQRLANDPSTLVSEAARLRLERLAHK